VVEQIAGERIVRTRESAIENKEQGRFHSSSQTGNALKVQPATLSTYRIGKDGRLAFVQAYDVETNGQTQWWSGFMRTG